MTRNKEKRGYNHESLAKLFGEYYGNQADRLDGWQALCQTCGLCPESSITKCQKSLRRVNVNIIDLIEARKADQVVDTYHSKGALANDMKDNPHRRFPKQLAKSNGFLRALLIQLR